MAKGRRCQRSHLATRGFAAKTDSTFDMRRNCKTAVVIFGWLVLVAGLHTRGKPYPADEQNIATYTAGRITARDLAVGA